MVAKGRLHKRSSEDQSGRDDLSTLASSIGWTGEEWQGAAFESAMQSFVRRQNVAHFRHLLDEIVTDETERQRILALLAEERQKQIDAGDFIKA
jgi:hypothetical protein